MRKGIFIEGLSLPNEYETYWVSIHYDGRGIIEGYSENTGFDKNSKKRIHIEEVEIEDSEDLNG